jgi:hypothetical protein
VKRPNINLHIDELVLRGFAAGDRYAIADAVQGELSRLLAAQTAGGFIPPALTNGADQPRLDAGSVQLTADAKANSIGVQIAQAVHGGISR